MSVGGNRNPDSPQPAAPPPWRAAANTGGEPSEGTQNEQQWRAGETDLRGIVDGSRKAGLYRLTLLGRNVSVSLRYGTEATINLTGLRLPIVLTVPGNVGVSAVPLDGAGAEISATLVRVTAPGTQHARRLVKVAATLHPAAVSFFTMAACSITIDGTNYPAVPAFTRIPLLQPAALVTGSGFEEFDT